MLDLPLDEELFPELLLLDELPEDLTADPLEEELLELELL
tara:strand:- start:2676 stop:2795 length:120 start_codon:yes stop_codon:yes gene_type:complete